METRFPRNAWVDGENPGRTKQKNTNSETDESIKRNKIRRWRMYAEYIMSKWSTTFFNCKICSNVNEKLQLIWSMTKDYKCVSILRFAEDEIRKGEKLIGLDLIGLESANKIPKVFRHCFPLLIKHVENEKVDVLICSQNDKRSNMH